MKKILFRKLLADCLIFFLITLFSSGIIIWIFQAVNFLDIIVEDGRNYLVYLNFSLLNFPKVVSKLVPFVLFFSFLFVIGKYELRNELIIFWNFGINKIDLINTWYLNTAIIENECIISLNRDIFEGPKYLLPRIESISFKTRKFFFTDPE